MLSVMPPWIFQFLYYCFLGLLSLFSLIIIQPHYVSQIVKSQIVDKVLIVLGGFMMLLLSDIRQLYSGDYSDFSGDLESIEYLKWQKGRASLQRDMYLISCNLILIVALFVTGRWIIKYNRAIDLAEQEAKNK